MPLASKPGASREGLKDFSKPEPKFVRCLGPLTSRQQIYELFSAGKISVKDKQHLLDMIEQMEASE